jgi:plastocyanin
MTLRFLAPLVLAGALGLAACGGGSSSSGDTIPADADVVVKAIDGIKWDQSSYSAQAGDVTIAAENVSSLPHNLHIVAADGTQLPQMIDLPNRGRVGTMTVTLAAGEYTLICTIPGHNNMKATLAVS